MLFCLLKDQHIFFFITGQIHFFGNSLNRNNQKGKEELIQKSLTDLKRDGYSTCILGIEFVRPDVYYFINI